jgi:hypothetical protein
VAGVALDLHRPAADDRVDRVSERELALRAERVHLAADLDHRAAQYSEERADFQTWPETGAQALAVPQ